MDKGVYPESPFKNRPRKRLGPGRLLEHIPIRRMMQSLQPSSPESNNKEPQEQLPSNEDETVVILGERTLEIAPLASTQVPQSEEPLSEHREQSTTFESAPLASALVPQSEDSAPLASPLVPPSEQPLSGSRESLEQSTTFESALLASALVPLSEDRDSFQNHQNGTHSNGSRQNRNPSRTASFPPLKDGERGPELVFKPEVGIQFEFCMPVVQKGNQRCTGPPYGHTGPPPSEECEVYGGLLPGDVYEDRIFGVFRRFGRIFRIRVLTKPDGSSQGYFHVHYYRKEAAELAVSELNGFKFLGESTDKSGIRLKQLTQINRLFISGIPNGFTNRHVYKALHGTKCEIGLTGVDVPQQMGYLNRGYCFLEYKDHKSALEAGNCIRNLKPFKANVVINWAIPQAPKVEDPENVGAYFYSNGHWIQDVPRGTIPIAPQHLQSP